MPQHRLIFFHKTTKKKEFFLVIILGTEKPSEAERSRAGKQEKVNAPARWELLCKTAVGGFADLENERDICSSSFSNGNLGGME